MSAFEIRVSQFACVFFGIVAAVCVAGIVLNGLLWLSPIFAEIEREQMKINWSQGWAGIKQYTLGLMVALVPFVLSDRSSVK